MALPPVRVSPLRDWSAWLPVAIPLFLIALAVRHVAIYGLVREADEGAEARLFQLLMPVQLLVMTHFAVTWLPRAPRTSLAVLAVQFGLAAGLFAAVYWIEHAP